MKIYPVLFVASVLAAAECLADESVSDSDAENLLSMHELRLIERSDLETLSARLSQNPGLANATSYREGRCSALAYAASLGHVQVAKLLIEREADLEARCHEPGYTPLMLACICNKQYEVSHRLCPPHLKLEDGEEDSHPKVVSALLEHGASFDQQDLLHGRAAIHFAALNGDEEILRRLINGGANPDMEDASHWTPLMYAVQRNDDAAIRMLLKNGARVDSVDASSGATALIQAAHLGHAAAVEALLAHGAAVGVRDRSSLTALDYAERSGNLPTMRLLHEAAGVPNDLHLEL
mmetsp:Transcript_6591/g.16797  ORF Transcript_6591/g.16797 Transcript_6591/m.16797 type:complete len:294 (-) Transcript_6591:97-978(-)|eukprot:CAMPEP_0202054848 /NCGR_PEP_ID=MMETSP0963-20130614/10716_1 /ASSEMBLY_ACC=CAM_ASM_000494 /TAXON_ID=4773 /ORGANISM="Schizochytrium aggregatum, Strain ATCC28209" /LENGTH=293 /DNA_ID=CAMNT_0048620331 /DNA_START=177 /DNA_END=1058 /DNA_ORIENTATION=-